MSPQAKCVCLVLMCMAPFLFVSCLGMAVPKSASLDPSSASGGRLAFPGRQEIDSALLDKWELTHRTNDKGQEDQPAEGKRTVIEFMDNGEVIFNKNASESDPTQRERGLYSAAKGELTVVDAKGNMSKWPYEVNGDMMVTTMPEKSQKFHWRRFR